jgi:hypothetical protein
MEIKFNEWFEEKYNVEKNVKSEPWTDFKTHIFTSELKRLIEGNKKKILISWEEEVRWQENDSIFDINVNPYGSLRITTRKEVQDFEGNKIRVCKYVYPINDFKINKETRIANFLYEKVKKISKKNIDYPVDRYKIENLAYKVYEHLEKNYPSYIMFPTKMIKMNENYYKIVFEFRGAGTGTPGQSVGMQFNIDLSFDKKIGYIKCWGYMVESPSKTRKFNIMPSDFNEYFSCKQSHERIIDMISKTFNKF